MEDVCRDVGDSGEALGPAGSTSGPLKSPETRTSRSRLCHHSHLLFFLPSFFAPSREALGTWLSFLPARGKLSTGSKPITVESGPSEQNTTQKNRAAIAC